jgi:septum formation protein
VDPADVEEIRHPEETAGDFVARLAIEKASAVASRHPRSWVLGGDTEVVVDGITLGKPADPADAARMLGELAGRDHVVLSSLALVRPEAEPDVEVASTRVRIRPLDPSEVERYVATGEPLDKAGAYGIQGLGATLVEEIEGDYTSVVGLPVGALQRLLARAGWRWGFSDGWIPTP